MIESAYEQNPALEEVRALRRNGRLVGVMLILLFVFSLFLYSAVVTVLMLAGLVPFSALTDPQLGLPNTAYLLLYLPVYVGVMGLPMLFACLFVRPGFSPLSLSRRVSPGLFAGCVLMGLGLCTAANFMTNLWTDFFGRFGITAPEMPELMENTAVSVLLNVLIFALLPALLEELMFRGYVLMALQPAGEGTAIVLSALLFGLMHGNLTQLPFAFLLGLCFGFFTLRLGNIWVAVTVHALNNALAVLLDSLLPYYLPDETAQGLCILAVFGLLLVGGICVLIILLALRHPLFTARPVSPPSCLTQGQRRAQVLRSPLLWVSAALFLVMTALNLTS